MKNANETLVSQPTQAATLQMTIPQIFYVMYTGKKNNDAKVSLHVRNGVRYLCIHKRFFDTFEGAINYLREDARNIVAPENRNFELAMAS